MDMKIFANITIGKAEDADKAGNRAEAARLLKLLAEVCTKQADQLLKETKDT